MKRLNPEKLHVRYLSGSTPDTFVLPRRYTLTHSDRTGELFLTIGDRYDQKQISGLYTRFMRDEVVAELAEYGTDLILKVQCHVSGGFVLGSARWRYDIFHSELPLVLEAIRYGDRTIFENFPEADNAPVHVHFQSKNNRYDTIENWGVIRDYR